MRFDIITVFPEAFESYLNTSILKRAQARGLISVHLHGLRKWGKGRHKQLDDKPYGGGAGMVLIAEPILRALRTIRRRKNSRVILFSASGKKFSQLKAARWARLDQLIMIAGRYEGVDARVRKFVDEETSIGDYILTGGELPAMVVVDAVSRHIPGVLGKAESLEERRYGVGVPMFTRPEALRLGKRTYRVPKVLLSGDHKKIEVWRKKHAP